MTEQTRFPKGWNEARVKRVIEHYGAQTEAGAIAEDEAALDLEDQTLMEFPNDLVPPVRELIAKKRKAS